MRGCAPICLALTLLVLRVLADDHDFTLALDYLALLAHGLHGRSYFHLLYLLLASPGDPAAGDVVWRHLHRDLVTGEDLDKVHPELSGNVSQYGVTVADIHLEHGVGQGFYDRALKFDYIVFCQSNFPPKFGVDVLSNILCHCEYFRLAICDEDGIFIVSREGAVRGDDRPAVGHFLHFVSADVDHGLDRYRHAAHETRIGTVAEAPVRPVVRNLGCLMELAPHTVADIIADDRIAVALHVILHRRAYIGDAVALLGELYALKEALSRNLDELSRLFAYLTAGVGAGAVADEALIGGAEVEGHDVAVSDHSLAGDTVYDLFVYRDAGAGRKSAVIEEGRVSAALDDEVMHMFVYLLCGHAVGHCLPRDGARGGGDLAGLTHQLNVSDGLDSNCFSHRQIPRALVIAAVVASMLGWFSTDFSLPRAS